MIRCGVRGAESPPYPEKQHYREYGVRTMAARVRSVGGRHRRWWPITPRSDGEAGRDGAGRGSTGVVLRLASVPDAS
jgi:hypothetical protein